MIVAYIIIPLITGLVLGNYIGYKSKEMEYEIQEHLEKEQSNKINLN